MIPPVCHCGVHRMVSRYSPPIPESVRIAIDHVTYIAYTRLFKAAAYMGTSGDKETRLGMSRKRLRRKQE